MLQHRFIRWPIIALALACSTHHTAGQTVYNTTAGQFAAAQVKLLPPLCEALLLLLLLSYIRRLC